MSAITTLFAITATVTLGAMSPGPSFVYVAQNAVARSRAHGLVTALGTGVGAAAFSLMALLGLQAFLLAVPVAYTGIKIAGGLYLLWLAYKIIKHAREPLHVGAVGKSDKSMMATFRDGLFTQLSNPKTAVVFASIFTALLPREIPAFYYVVLPVLCFVIDAGWYSIVTLVLSSEKPRNAYLRFKTVIDRLAGGVMGILGLKLIFFSR
ncbi:threonine transporter [Klebsiella michiganensis]|nr:threonine transporter [Klebsiella michiganensis]